MPDLQTLLVQISVILVSVILVSVILVPSYLIGRFLRKFRLPQVASLLFSFSSQPVSFQ
jgi:hypothetical protein